MSKLFNTPILIIGFNRPKMIGRVIANIKKIQPQNLYISIDGPRNKKEKSKIDAVKKVIKSIDWQCTVKTHFQKKNLGCKYGPVSAMNWLFLHETKGIILEDDVLADPSFFYFSAELLKKYERDQRIGCISGNNFQFDHNDNKDSYYFSRYSHTWGWATWRRVWEKYDPEITNWPKLKKENFLNQIFDKWIDRQYWELIFNNVYSKENNSVWDYQWTLMMWANRMLGIIPNRNLVSNIGYGSDATHTRFKSKLTEMEIFPLQFPLVHPKTVSRNRSADIKTQKQNYVLWKELGMIIIRKIVFVKNILLSRK